MSDELHKKNLANARRRAVSVAKGAVAKVKSAKNIFSALKQADFSKDWPYVLAFFAGAGKDIIDGPGIGSLPGVGTVITMCVSIFIFFMTLYAALSEKGGIGKKIWKRFMVLLLGTISEMILFGWNFIPAESGSAVIIYIMALFEKAGGAEEK
jgi:hypothetical protein